MRILRFDGGSSLILVFNILVILDLAVRQVKTEELNMSLIDSYSNK